MTGHPGAGYWIFAAVSGLLALMSLVLCFRRLRRDRFIADTPLVRMRSAAQGYVRIEGRAGPPPGEDLRSPLSDRPCVWWDYQVEQKQQDERGKMAWRTIQQATSVTPFVLTDADGECLIGPVGAEVTATSDDRWSGMSLHTGGPPPFQSLLKVIPGDEYHYHERLITQGSRLCVLGELRSHTEFGAVDRKTQEILAQWKRNQPALLKRFDRNHDGHIKADEWEIARNAAHVEAEATVLHSPIERVGVVGQTTHGEPFLIAPLDGRHLVRRERRDAALLLFASVLLVWMSIWAAGQAS